jgi:hypothetical protein
MTVISSLFALCPRGGYRIFDHGGPRQKLHMALADASDGVTSGCRSLVEGVLMMFLQFELMDSIPPVSSYFPWWHRFAHASLVVS